MARDENLLVEAAIEFLRKSLGDVNRAYIAGLVTVDPRTFDHWKNKRLPELKGKGEILNRLYQVILAITNSYKNEFTPAMLKSILHNGRVPVAPTSDGDDIYLIEYIQAEPSSSGWWANVQHAVSDFSKSR